MPHIVQQQQSLHDEDTMLLSEQENDPNVETSEGYCRICREHAPLAELIAPCDCRGTMKWVHSDCWERSNRRCVPCNTTTNATLRDQIAAALEQELQQIHGLTDIHNIPLEFSFDHIPLSHSDENDEPNNTNTNALAIMLTTFIPSLLSMLEHTRMDGNRVRHQQFNLIRRLESVITSKPIIMFSVLCLLTASMCLLSLSLVAMRIGYNAIFQ